MRTPSSTSARHVASFASGVGMAARAVFAGHGAKSYELALDAAARALEAARTELGAQLNAAMQPGARHE